MLPRTHLTNGLLGQPRNPFALVTNLDWNLHAVMPVRVCCQLDTVLLALSVMMAV